MLQQVNKHGIPQNCPACKATTQTIQYQYKTDSSYSFIYYCPTCTLEFLRPLPLSELTDRQMDSIDDAEMFNSSMLQYLHHHFIIKPEIKKVRKLTGKDSFSTLDVGCGTGWISELWANADAVVTGLEPSKNRANLARKRNIRVLSCYVEDMSTDEIFDVIILRHVVEHFEKPDAILTSLKKHLCPGGVILVVVPNIKCIGRLLFGIHWTWVLPWHCNFFTPRSLKRLLNESGYAVETIYQTPSPLWYAESFARKYERLGRYLGNSPLAKLLFSPIALFGTLVGFGDNLTIIARKTKQGKAQ